MALISSQPFDRARPRRARAPPPHAQDGTGPLAMARPRRLPRRQSGPIIHQRRHRRLGRQEPNRFDIDNNLTKFVFLLAYAMIWWPCQVGPGAHRPRGPRLAFALVLDWQANPITCPAGTKRPLQKARRGGSVAQREDQRSCSKSRRLSKHGLLRVERQPEDLRGDARPGREGDQGARTTSLTLVLARSEPGRRTSSRSPTPFTIGPQVLLTSRTCLGTCRTYMELSTLPAGTGGTSY